MFSIISGTPTDRQSSKETNCAWEARTVVGILISPGANSQERASNYIIRKRFAKRLHHPKKLHLEFVGATITRQAYARTK